MSNQAKQRRMKITLTVWAVWFVASHLAEAAGLRFNPWIAWPILACVVMGTLYWQFVQGRPGSD